MHGEAPSGIPSGLSDHPSQLPVQSDFVNGPCPVQLPLDLAPPALGQSLPQAHPHQRAIPVVELSLLRLHSDSAEAGMSPACGLLTLRLFLHSFFTVVRVGFSAENHFLVCGREWSCATPGMAEEALPPN